MNITPKKHTRSPAWLDALVSSVNLDFVAPYPLETSLKLLKDEEDTRWFMPRKIVVDLIPEDADTFKFVYRMWGKGYHQVKADGTLKCWEVDSTHITAQVNLALISYLWKSLGTGFVILVILSVYIQNTMLLLLLVAISIALAFYHIRRQRQQIADQIEAAFHTTALSAN